MSAVTVGSWPRRAMSSSLARAFLPVTTTSPPPSPPSQPLPSAPAASNPPEIRSPLPPPPPPPFSKLGSVERVSKNRSVHRSAECPYESEKRGYSIRCNNNVMSSTEKPDEAASFLAEARFSDEIEVVSRWKPSQDGRMFRSID